MNKIIALLLFYCVFFYSCGKDAIAPVTSDNGIYWVGKWNRDSVVLNDIAGNGIKSRIEVLINDGQFTFNSDSISGILTQGSNEYAITWLYNKGSNSMVISEPGWINQHYSISAQTKDNITLTGIRNNRLNKSERIMYLIRK